MCAQGKWSSLNVNENKNIDEYLHLRRRILKNILRTK